MIIRSLFTFFLICVTLFVNSTSRANDTPKDLFMRAYAHSIELNELIELGLFFTCVEKKLLENTALTKDILLTELERLLNQDPPLKTDFFLQEVQNYLTYMREGFDVLQDSKQAFLNKFIDYIPKYHTRLLIPLFKKNMAAIKLALESNATAAQEGKFLPLSIITKAFDGDLASQLLAASLFEFGHLGMPLDPSALYYVCMLMCSWVEPTFMDRSKKEQGVLFLLHIGAGNGLKDSYASVANHIYTHDFCLNNEEFNATQNEMTPEDIRRKWLLYTQESKETLPGVTTFFFKETPLLTREICKTILEVSAPQRKQAMINQLHKEYGVPLHQKENCKKSNEASNHEE